jgi:hypothetical protein
LLKGGPRISIATPSLRWENMPMVVDIYASEDDAGCAVSMRVKDNTHQNAEPEKSIRAQ